MEYIYVETEEGSDFGNWRDGINKKIFKKYNRRKDFVDTICDYVDFLRSEHIESYNQEYMAVISNLPKRIFNPMVQDGKMNNLMVTLAQIVDAILPSYHSA